MSQQIEGLVRKVFEKRSPGKTTMYSLVIGDNMDAGGDGIFYGTGSTKPDVNEGDRVSFAATQKGKWWDADPSTIKVVEAGAAKPPAQNRSGGGGYKGGFSPEKEASIVMQSSSKTAADLVSTLVAAGTKVKDLETLMDLHAEITLKVYNRCTRPLEFIKSVATPEEVQQAVATDGNKEVVSDF